MGSIRLDGDPSVEIAVRRSARARRLSLRVSSLDGRVTLTLPTRVPLAEGQAFAEERSDWIRGARAQAHPVVRIEDGAEIPVEGDTATVRVERRRSAQLDGATLRLPARAPGKAAAAFLKLRARDRLARACDDHVAALGKSYSTLALRDTRSRWGSCSQAGRLMFSWRLVMAPPDVLNYVAAHEVAHLAHMDHSPAFWSVVEQLDPTWRAHRSWLREHGTRLHAYHFAD